MITSSFLSEPEQDGVEHLDSYLTIAYLALRLEDRPLHTTEILRTAKRYKFFPPHLTGKTPHKTLNARLAEHIRKEGASALFYRTAPATYFLSKKAERLPAEQQPGVFHGIRRDKAVKKENVLVADKAVLRDTFFGSLVPFDRKQFDSFFSNHCYFMDRAEAEKNDAVKQFVSFTVFHHKHEILVYRRGKYSTASDQLKGAYSVGFGGHVSDDDFTLFATSADAIVENSSRELMEELYLSQMYQSPDEISDRSSIVGLINVDDSSDAQHHIAMLVKFSHDTRKLSKKGGLSINDLRWLDTQARLNDTSDFDLWSRLILENIFSGEIPLGEADARQKR